MNVSCEHLILQQNIFYFFNIKHKANFFLFFFLQQILTLLHKIKTFLKCDFYFFLCFTVCAFTGSRP